MQGQQFPTPAHIPNLSDRRLLPAFQPPACRPHAARRCPHGRLAIGFPCNPGRIGDWFRVKLVIHSSPIIHLHDFTIKSKREAQLEPAFLKQMLYFHRKASSIPCRDIKRTVVSSDCQTSTCSPPYPRFQCWALRECSGRALKRTVSVDDCQLQKPKQH